MIRHIRRARRPTAAHRRFSPRLLTHLARLASPLTVRNTRYFDAGIGRCSAICVSVPWMLVN
jgi:hypothetical protein